MSEDQYKKIFSTNLKRYMELNGKSQIDIINDLGFNKSAVSTWCNGTRLPRMDKVDALAKYFGVNRSDLIEEHKEAEKVSANSNNIESENGTNSDDVAERYRIILDAIKNLSDEEFNKVLDYIGYIQYSKKHSNVSKITEKPGTYHLNIGKTLCVAEDTVDYSYKKDTNK